MAKEWERHNSPTGTHIWCGQEHIADITGEGQNEVAQIAVTAHNTCQELNPENPLAVVEGVKRFIKVCNKELNGADVTQENLDKVLDELSKITGGK